MKKISNVFNKLLKSFKSKFKSEDEKISTLDEGDTRIIEPEDKSSIFSRVSNKAKGLFRYKQKKQDFTHTSALSIVEENGSIFKERKKNPNFYVGVVLKTINILFLACFVVASIGFGILWGIAKAYIETTPTLNTEKIANQSETTFLYDANGDFLAAYIGAENREWAASDEIPEMLKNAFIAVEDVRFNYHNGIDIKRLMGAAVSNFMNESVQGGSTITQQLVKNTMLSFDRTYKRKIQEAFLAIQLEQEYTKDEILVSYLNTIDLGGGNYGVKAASKDYFNKDLDELSIKECAIIAGTTQNPYAHNPRRAVYGSGSMERVKNRLELVLNRMYEASFITKQERDLALTEQMQVIEESTVHSMYNMPYFVEYTISEVITKLLESRNMKTDDAANRNAVELEIRNNGYKIYTTVDPDIQRKVEDSLKNWDKYPKTAKSSDSIVTSKGSNGTIFETIQPQAASVVLDHTNGQIKAIVGGRNNPDVKKAMNRVTSNMPVGSSIKPIGVYAPAIDKGLSPATIIPNIPVPIDGWNTSAGYPATSESTFGPVSLRKGLVKSINIVAARTLLDHVGIQDSRDYLINMGVNPKHINEDPAGLSMGTSGITPIEMAVAFGCIANGGEYISPISFTLVLDKDDNVVFDATKSQERRQAIKPSTAYILADMLQDAVNYGTGKNAKISGINVGGKTGTNQESRGIYFTGITPYYSSALWVGHDNYKPLKSNAYASSYAAPLWKDYMTKVHDGLDNKAIIEESAQSLGLTRMTVCPVSGKISTDYCSNDLSARELITDWFVVNNISNEVCDIHQPTTQICAASNKFINAYCPENQQISASPIFLESSSPYLKLDQPMLKSILPLAFEVPQSKLWMENLNTENPEYSKYYCTVHNESWDETAVKRPKAIKQAKKMIDKVFTFVQERILDISPNDANALDALITDLQTVIDDPLSMSELIVIKTNELESYYEIVKYNYETAPGDVEDVDGQADVGDGDDGSGAVDPFEPQDDPPPDDGDDFN
jgi:penicillin-binding protein 1A